MLFLIGEIIGYLVLAILLGMIGGWVLRGLMNQASTATVDERWRSRVEEAEALREKFRTERDQAVASIESLQGQLDTTEGKREMQRAELASLRADLSEFSDTGDELSRTKAELLSLKQQLRSARETAANYRSQLELKARETAEYRLQYEKALQTLNANKKEHQDFLRSLESTPPTAPSTDKIIQELETLLSEREDEIRELEGRLSSPTDSSTGESLNQSIDGFQSVKEPQLAGPRSQQQISVDRQPDWLVDTNVDDADDLKMIKGIGPVLESTLNSIGVYYYAQISKMNNADIRWVSEQIGTFPKRIVQDKWVQQATALQAARHVTE